MGNVYVFDHPLIQHKTAMIRKTDTTVKDFRELVKEISMLMGYEATRHLPLKLRLQLLCRMLKLICLQAKISLSYLS